MALPIAFAPPATNPRVAPEGAGAGLDNDPLLPCLRSIASLARRCWRLPAVGCVLGAGPLGAVLGAVPLMRAIMPADLPLVRAK